ncbi:hypothetical protein HYPSUDRAFT_214329 [Hypholoma sublateritium FD-334 SS-4]|uniref:Uncharacterized protein n=1 Tax=Hypholoma sublateritium (strain FD-334 SS-4) TaxID=945553 RepID=A0A0D2P1F1_HYPSF|nr:hypothetical protein HYPSUDRAFT_214329 [Hypholoma sublateritium FD-334 SS-4]
MRPGVVSTCYKREKRLNLLERAPRHKMQYIYVLFFSVIGVLVHSARSSPMERRLATCQFFNPTQPASCAASCAACCKANPTVSECTPEALCIGDCRGF